MTELMQKLVTVSVLSLSENMWHLFWKNSVLVATKYSTWRGGEVQQPRQMCNILHPLEDVHTLGERQ